jgi:hypothetical protein
MRHIIKFITFVGIFFLLPSCKRKIEFPEGGYSYSTPLYKNLKDSFNSSHYFNIWSAAYKEPDLTKKPLSQTTIRLTYETAFGNSAIFTMTENQIVVKRPIQGSPYPDLDSMKLTPEERSHFRILKRYFPIQELDSTITKKGMLDSLSKIYPKLLDPIYYKYLLDKSIVADSIQFKYNVKKVQIPYSKYTEIISKINSSGYWKLPLHIECDDTPTDGYGFLLEVNTNQKFNLVGLTNCPEKALKFSEACQAIINAANLGKEIIIVE